MVYEDHLDEIKAYDMSQVPAGPHGPLCASGGVKGDNLSRRLTLQARLKIAIANLKNHDVQHDGLVAPRVDCGHPKKEKERSTEASEPHGCIEFCTSERSTLTTVLEEYGKVGVRLTPEFIDCANDTAIDILVAQLGEPGACYDLFGSIPCDPWSSWQSMCLHTQGPEYAVELERRRHHSRQVFRNFRRVAEAARAHGGRIAFEWPRHATGWKLPEVQQLITDLNLYVCDCDGCAFGLSNSKDEPLLKQWRVVTDCGRLARALSERRCRHPPGFKHGEISGSTSPKTAAYPRAMCETIASALYPKTVFGHVPAMTCIRVPEAPQEHRQREFVAVDHADIPMWCPKGAIVALPADVGADDEGETEDGIITAVGIGAVPDLPGDLRREAKAGKKGVKVVFSSEATPERLNTDADKTPDELRSILKPTPSAAPSGNEEIKYLLPNTLGGEELSVKERRAAEARTLRHLVLHETKNHECDSCTVGRMRKASVSVSKGRALDPDLEAQAQRPTAHGQLFSCDNVIASEGQTGTGGARTALHIRDHYSGALAEYASRARNVDNNRKAMKHFAGSKYVGANVLCKCDDADELKDAAELLAWTVFSSLPREWPHNTHCERDIGITKDLAGAIFESSGFPDKAWPLVLEFTAMARTFFSSAPIYPYEVGTAHEEFKRGKTRYEVATGHPFSGKEYPLGALVFYRRKRSVPGGSKSVPGYFAGWRLEPGLGHRGVLKIIDYENVQRNRIGAFTPLEYRADEVTFPKVANITFPLRNAKEKAIKQGTDFWEELSQAGPPPGAPDEADDGEALQEPSSGSGSAAAPPAEPATEPAPPAPPNKKKNNAPITILRKIEIGPTVAIPGIYCGACENKTTKHSKACRDRSNAAYRDMRNSDEAKKLDGAVPEKVLASSKEKGAETEVTAVTNAEPASSSAAPPAEGDAEPAGAPEVQL